MQLVTPDQLRGHLSGAAEVALLDVREEVDFHASHLLFAVNTPLSRLEQIIWDLVPRFAAPIVLCDAGNGFAGRAAATLEGLGYTDVALLDGGIAAWESAGGMLFAGANVPSKAFGEFVEHECETPRISADELKQRMESGDDLVVLDSRPWEEYQIMSIPGGQNCPGAELVYRRREAVTSPDTLVVVNCAGRTRSIIGAQSLINSGISNRVVALKDGTMGWELAGYSVARKSDRRAPAASAAGIEEARRAARRVADRAGVRMIDGAILDRFRSERGERTLYVLDVRTPDEYVTGHLADALPAFGGQLVQATDRYVGVRGARLVLVDDTEARALMTASWLRQMGWEDVFVLEQGIMAHPLTPGSHRAAILGIDRVSPATLPPAAAKAMLDSGRATVIDLADARRFKAEHIAGAWYAVRSKLPAGLERLAADTQIILTSSDGLIARLAAAEGITGRETVALEGGTAAWKAAGLPMESGDRRLLHPLREMWSPYDDARRTRRSMLDYLSWEVDLYDRVKRDGIARFRRLSSV